MILRLLNPQGITGAVVSAALAILLLLAKIDARHWEAQSGKFEQLYGEEQTALAGTVANYRAAAVAARASDKANAERVAAEQRSINERTLNDFEARLAAARARADELRRQDSLAAANPGSRRSAAMPRLPRAAGGFAQSTGEDRLSYADALIATEQAIQLDELIKWVRAQSKVDNDGTAVTNSTAR